MKKIDYTSLLQVKRFKHEESSSPDLETALSSDKSRVIFSSSFRRLQQKTQVFGLETNAAVRSRLTHTLEVANTGSLIAKQVANKLISEGKLEKDLKVPFIDITETCCLLHDIGNPPFGHFGEEAIKKWFKENWESIIKESLKKDPHSLANTSILDFIHFDGNPQGIRIMLHLQGLPEDKEGYGLNLTYSQILSCVKYNATPEKVQAGEKAGYFITEEEKIKAVKDFLKWDVRFPITYIMEAADDISYCLSDIEDGIEKGIIEPRFFFEKLLELWWPENIDIYNFPLTKESIENGKGDKVNFERTPSKRDFYRFKIVLTRELTNIAASIFLKNQDAILDGTIKDLFKTHTESTKALHSLKTFARQYLFRSKEAENIELAGYGVIFGLLASLNPLLILSIDKFSLLVQSKDSLNLPKDANLDVEWRLFNKLPDKHVDAYSNALKSIEGGESYSTEEWFLRAHLIVDYISGMTDHFALEMYRLFNGIKF